MKQTDFDDILKHLSRSPERLRELLSDVPSAAFNYKPAEEQFSILENVCHLRDIEVEGYSKRIRRIIDEDNPELPDIDGARLAIERDYNHQDLSNAVTAFVEARNHNLALLEQIDSQTLSRSGNLQGVGTVTLRKLLEMMAEHDEGHMEELRNLRRLVMVRS